MMSTSDKMQLTHKPFFTVVVPVYNAQAYLEDNIQTVLDQSFGDFELWLVDDGSPDDSGKICDAIASRDARVHVHHQENAGPSKARNYGLEHAAGQYVCFMDADDKVKPDWLEAYHGQADADILIQGVELIAIDGKITIVKAEDNLYSIDEGGKSKLIEQLPFTLLWVTWTKSFRKDFLMENGLRYNETIRRDEDPLFMITSLPLCKTIRNINHVGYCCQAAHSFLSKIKYDFESFRSIRQLVVDAMDRCFADDKHCRGYQIFCTRIFGHGFSRILFGGFHTPRSVRLSAYRWFKGYRAFFDYGLLEKNLQIYRLLCLPDWLFDIVLIVYSCFYAILRRMTPRCIKNAIEKVYHIMRSKKYPNP